MTHATMLQGQEKMSKSDPNSAIFMEDTEQEVSTNMLFDFAAFGSATGLPDSCCL